MARSRSRKVAGPQKLTKRQVVAKQQVKKALEGDQRAIQTLLKLTETLAAAIKQEAANASETSPDMPLDHHDAALLADFANEFLERFEPSGKNRSQDWDLEACSMEELKP